MKTFKIALWSFDRTENQWDGILRNRYVVKLSTEPSFGIFHETLSDKNEWRSGYSWWDLSLTNFEREDKPDKEFLFGLLKRYDDYYDGPIITWVLWLVQINYRW